MGSKGLVNLKNRKTLDLGQKEVGSKNANGNHHGEKDKANRKRGRRRNGEHGSDNRRARPIRPGGQAGRFSARDRCNTVTSINAQAS